LKEVKLVKLLENDIEEEIHFLFLGKKSLVLLENNERKNRFKKSPKMLLSININFFLKYKLITIFGKIPNPYKPLKE
jgi:hypothetical protein